MDNLWYMVNVVWYDGVDAYVSKFVVQAEMITEKIGEPGFPQITNDSRRRISKYLDGNGEILKVDPLYPVELENIMALKGSDNSELQAAFDRFKAFWF